MVAHNCQGKTKNLTAKAKYLTPKPKTSRQKQNTSRQNQKLHGKNKNITAKPKTSKQKQNTSRQNQILHSKSKIALVLLWVLLLPWGIWFLLWSIWFLLWSIWFLLWSIWFCCEVFIFAVRFSVLPWGILFLSWGFHFWFCRDSCVPSSRPPWTTQFSERGSSGRMLVMWLTCRFYGGWEVGVTDPQTDSLSGKYEHENITGGEERRLSPFLFSPFSQITCLFSSAFHLCVIPTIWKLGTG